jgi:peroxiredoxin
METVTRNVSDLPPLDHSSFERVLGHELSDSQQLVIQIVSTAKTPDILIGQSLPGWCNVFAGLSDAEVDDITSAIVRDHSTRMLP